MPNVPTNEQLQQVARFAESFDVPGFSAGEWVVPEPTEDGVTQMGWWSSSEAVERWHEALYDNGIIDGSSDYLGADTKTLVRGLMERPVGVADLGLAELRTVLTFLARAERHTGGGWFEQAFQSGLAQSATRRLGVLARSDGQETP